MKDLISIDDLSTNDIDLIHKRADFFHVNFDEHHQILNNKILINFFFENSTRTRMSFEIAGKKMGAKVVNLDISCDTNKKRLGTTYYINHKKYSKIKIVK